MSPRSAFFPVGFALLQVGCAALVVPLGGCGGMQFKGFPNVDSGSGGGGGIPIGGNGGGNDGGATTGLPPTFKSDTRITSDATMADVTADEQWLAYYTGSPKVPSAVAAAGSASAGGTLWVAPLTGTGAPRHLTPVAADVAFGATFGQSDLLLYGKNPVTAGGASYGALYAWAPWTPDPVALTHDNDVSLAWTAPPDHTFVLTWNSPDATPTQPHPLLLYTDTSTLSPTMAQVTLASSVVVTRMVSSPYTSNAAYLAQNAADGMIETWLVDASAGTQTRVAQTPASTAGAPATVAMAYSSDGSLLATTDQGILKVVSTVTGMQMMWPPDFTVVDPNLAFVDGGAGILTYAESLPSGPGLYVIGSGTAKLVVAGKPLAWSIAPAAGDQAGTCLVAVEGTAAAPVTQVWSLGTLTLTEKQSGAGPGDYLVGNDSVSATGEAALLLGDASATTGVGTVNYLNTGNCTLTLVNGVGAQMSGIGFAGVANTALYIDQPDANGVGSLSSWDGAAHLVGANVYQFAARGQNVYTTVVAPGSTAAIYGAPVPE